MKIDEAIEVLARHHKDRGIFRDDEIQDAIRSGIEALKRIKASRIRRLADFTELLPGETEEEKDDLFDI